MTASGFAPRQRLAFQRWGRQVEARHRGVDAKVWTPFFRLHALVKLRRAISLRRHDLVAELDPDNAGVLIVQLGGRKSGRRAIGADEVTRRLEKSGESCVIM